MSRRQDLAVDVGEQGVSEANWDKTAFEINGEPVSLREEFFICG